MFKGITLAEKKEAYNAMGKYKIRVYENNFIFLPIVNGRIRDYEEGEYEFLDFDTLPVLCSGYIDHVFQTTKLQDLVDILTKKGE